MVRVLRIQNIASVIESRKSSIVILFNCNKKAALSCVEFQSPVLHTLYELVLYIM